MENRRHHLIVLGGMQHRIILGAVLGAMLLINIVIIAWFLLDPALLLSLDTSDTLAIALVELGVVGLIFYISLLASNKIAGPIYAFDKELLRLRSGDLTARLHLRRGDILIETAATFNDTIEALRSQIAALQQESATVRSLEAGHPQREALLEKLLLQLDKLKTE